MLEEVSMIHGSSTMLNLPMKPHNLDVISSMSFESDGFFDLINTAVLSRTVAIAFRPAALIVSPDSVWN